MIMEKLIKTLICKTWEIALKVNEAISFSCRNVANMIHDIQINILQRYIVKNKSNPFYKRYVMENTYGSEKQL